MKKVLLLLVGMIAIGLYENSQVSAQEEKNVEAEITAYTEPDGEASDGESQEASRSGGLARSAGTRTGDFQKRFNIEVTDGAANSVSASMPNTKVSIFYWHNDKATYVYKGRTNASGEILYLSFYDITKEVTALGVRFTL